ncbi:nucleoside-diphosphate kinase [Clostridium sp. MSJ-11]|uniref:Nucleoside diphosphate kinase n=1 Tax=Clostridium mobile TaxID=2841512 RepID=A0ABS6EK10_9CLOT|nr:nucleoside-diphosphate kinase [Clostridium mobile]MBU5485550.1 nucleoside-diphosphate kinase [Clostridium mobile]
MERTLVLIKPDGIKRNLIGEIISFYERKDLKIIGLKMIQGNVNTIEEHYIEHKEKKYYKELIEYLMEGPIIAMLIEGENAIKFVRKINGATDPLEADMGSIRGMYALTKQRNLVHSSDSEISAERERKIWFPEIK